jgi:hypothetical protein
MPSPRHKRKTLMSSESLSDLLSSPLKPDLNLAMTKLRTTAHEPAKNTLAKKGKKVSFTDQPKSIDESTMSAENFFKEEKLDSKTKEIFYWLKVRNKEKRQLKNVEQNRTIN